MSPYVLYGLLGICLLISLAFFWRRGVGHRIWIAVIVLTALFALGVPFVVDWTGSIFYSLAIYACLGAMLLLLTLLWVIRQGREAEDTQYAELSELEGAQDMELPLEGRRVPLDRPMLRYVSTMYTQDAPGPVDVTERAEGIALTHAEEEPVTGLAFAGEDAAVGEIPAHVEGIDAIIEEGIAQPEAEAQAEEATAELEAEVVVEEAVVEPEVEAIVEEAVVEPEAEVVVEEAVAEPEAEAVVEEAVAEPEAEAVVEEVIAEPEAEVVVEEAVAESEAEAVIEEAAVEPEVEVVFEEAAVEPEAEVVVEEAVAEPEAEVVIEEAIAEPEAEVIYEQPQQQEETAQAIVWDVIESAAPQATAEPIPEPVRAAPPQEPSKPSSTQFAGAQLLDRAFALKWAGQWSQAADAFMAFRETLTDMPWARKQADIECLVALFKAGRMYEATDLTFVILSSDYQLSAPEREQIEAILSGLRRS